MLVFVLPSISCSSFIGGGSFGSLASHGVNVFFFFEMETSFFIDNKLKVQESYTVRVMDLERRERDDQ